MSFPRYPKYKDSGVEWLGEVPDGWSVHSLRHHLNAVFNGLTANQIDESEATVPVTRIETISRGVIDFDRVGHILVEDARQDRRLIKGDILFSNINSLSMIGNCAKYDGNPVLYAGMNLLVLRPIDGVSSDWLFWAIRSSSFRQVVESYAKPAINQASISQSSLLSIFIVSPSIGEQQAIASFLDRETAKIDALVAEQENLIALLKEKRQAVISHAVTKGLDPTVPMKDSGIEWLGEVPDHWQIKKLKHVKANTQNAFVDGPFGSNLKSEHFIDDGDVYVIESNFATQGRLDFPQLKTISQNHFETIKRSEVMAGDIVLAKIGAQFGKASILPMIDRPAVVSGNSMKLSVNQDICCTHWAYWQLYNLKNNGEIDLLVNGSAQPALSLGGMNELVILMPPLSEQSQIVGFINTQTAKLDDLTTEARHTIELLKERRSALISATVTGKIDVRGLV